MAKIAKVQEVAVADLRPYERNAKTHDEEQIEKIAESIRAFGFLSPLLIDGDMNVIAGHGRIMAAKKLGIEKVPCVFIEGLTDEQRRAYILADNRLTELGGWDMNIINAELQELVDADFDITLTGFSIDSIDDDGFTDEFTLKDGDRAPIQTMSITLADEEAEIVNKAIKQMKSTQKFKDYDNPINKNSNGNALFLVVEEWLQQRI